MHWNNTVSTSPERWKCGPSLKQHWVSAPPRTCVTELFELTGQVASSERVITNTTATKTQYIYIYIFFFHKIWYLAENEREKIAFPIHLFFEGNVKHPIFTVWRLFTSDSDVKSRQTKKERNAKTVAMATNLLYIMRFHRSLCIFIIIFTRFSLISQPILNRFSRNFADTICNYYGDWPEKLVEFEPVLQKLLMRLFLNSIGYDKIY